MSPEDLCGKSGQRWVWVEDLRRGVSRRMVVDSRRRVCSVAIDPFHFEFRPHRSRRSLRPPLLNEGTSQDSKQTSIAQLCIRVVNYFKL